MRGEDIDPIDENTPIPVPLPWIFSPNDEAADSDYDSSLTSAVQTAARVLPYIDIAAEREGFSVVGKSEPKVDAIKLALGKPAFAADFEIRNLLVAKILHSPHAHAIIKKIDAGQARAFPMRMQL
jgi:putative selenate reductase molybdopterin-binding subunit